MSGRVPGRLYGLILAVLPRDFRARYGAEMRRMFEEEWAEARAIGRLRLVLRTLGGLVWTAFAERISPGYARPAAAGDGALRGIWRDVRMAVRGLFLNQRPFPQATDGLAHQRQRAVMGVLTQIGRALSQGPQPFAGSLANGPGINL
jgi:hypothetical protein